MLRRSGKILSKGEMIQSIKRALEIAEYADIEGLYIFAECAGLIEEKEEYERED